MVSIASPSFHLEAQRDFLFGPGQHLERYLEYDAQRAERTCHQTGEIESGDVLHHLAAEAQVFACAVQARGCRARNRAPSRRRRGAVPRSRLQRSRPASRWDRSRAARTPASDRPAASASSISESGVPARAVMHQLARLVVDDAAIAGYVQRFALELVGVEVLAAAAADAQRALCALPPHECARSGRRKTGPLATESSESILDANAARRALRLRLGASARSKNAEARETSPARGARASNRTRRSGAA